MFTAWHIIILCIAILGQEVQEDFQHRVVVKEDGVRSLIISPATTDDSGEYTVIAESQAGKAITTLSLTVIRKFKYRVFLSSRVLRFVISAVKE